METPALAQLMGAYLHQDYRMIGDLSDNVDAFIAESPELAPLLPAEVDWALEHYRSEEDLKRFLFSLGCELSALAGEGGYRGWLRQAARQVKTRLAAQP